MGRSSRAKKQAESQVNTNSVEPKTTANRPNPTSVSSKNENVATSTTSGPLQVPRWATLTSGFASGLALIWCISWPVMCLMFSPNHIAEVVMDDVYVFIGLTILPIAMMLSLESFFNRNHVVMTKLGLRYVGVARMAGTILGLFILRYIYFERLMNIESDST